jgi:hypothetical protein
MHHFTGERCELLKIVPALGTAICKVFEALIAACPLVLAGSLAGDFSRAEVAF